MGEMQSKNERMMERLARLQAEEQKMAFLEEENERLKQEQAALKSLLEERQHQLSIWSQ